MVVFATSLLEGTAQDWWVHLQDSYWYTPHHNNDNNDYNAGPRYQYPSWEAFIEIFHEQFRDPVIEEIHETEMGELRIGNQPAHIYFQKLEQIAKLVNQWDDESN